MEEPDHAMDYCQNRSRRWLNEEFSRRRQKNSKYSIRAYARCAGLNSGAMSQILAGRRPLTLKQAEKIAAAFDLEGKCKQEFLGSATAEQNRLGASSAPYRVLKADIFKFIADWYHYATLSLLDTDDPPRTSQAIAKRLGIEVKTARDAIDRLLRLGLIHRIDGRWVVDTEALRTTEDIPSQAIRESHRQILKKIDVALDDVDVSRRDSSYVSFCCDPKDLPKAKKLIRRFRRHFTNALEVGSKKEVYAISIHLIPLTQEGENGSP
jgi:uncharacterized protein (TIGR02147 family)